MKKIFIFALALMAPVSVFAEPVSVTDAGVTALTDNIVLNDDNPIINGGGLESIGVAILSNGNVIIGWEDDDADIAAGWVMIDSAGNRVTTDILAYANDDGTPTAANGGWGPKIHANLYGDGATFASSFWDWIGADDPLNKIPSLEQIGSDDEPAIQIINNDGTFNGAIIPGFSIDFLQRDGAIRVGDAELLSNGNIVVIGEDRQADDGPNLGLPNADRVVIGGIVAPDRTVIAGPIAVQQADARGEMWHGVATDQNGFGVRYSADGVKIRFFDNDLNPLTDEIALEGDLNSGGRGDDTGWHGNGNGDYLLATQTGKRCIATVFDNTGQMKFDPIDADEPDPDFGIGAGRVDGAIDENGNFVLVYKDTSLFDYFEDISIIAARFFNADGTPFTPPFVVSSAASDLDAALANFAYIDSEPRVAMRNGLVAVAWQDGNMNELGIQETVVRIFESPFVTSVQDWALY